MIERAEGTDLIDTDGRRYIDGVSSLWCNVHGHRHPRIDAAVRDQLDRVAHSTMLGLTAPGRRRAGRAPGRDRPAGPDARLLLGLGLDGDRDRAEDGVPVLAASAAASTRGARRSSRLRDAYHGDTLGAVSVGGIDLFHAAYEPLLFDAASRRRPATPASSSGCSSRHGERDRRRDRRAARPGRRRDARPARRLPARGARALRPPRRAADLRRGRDRLRPHRDDVRLRAGARRARLPLPRQGPDRRLPAARRDARRPSASTRASSARHEDVPHVLPRPHVHRQPARLRGGARQPRRLRAGAHAACACSRRSGCSASCSAEVAAMHEVARGPRPRASWSASTSASTTRRCASATG